MARIFLAGAESLELLTTLVDTGAQDIMLSFYYLQQRGALPKLLAFIQKHPHLRIFMDSGAATFVQKDRGNPQPYWKAYFDFLRGRGHHFEYASEFDIDGYTWDDKGRTRTVSQEQIDVWRDDLQELETVTIVPIWHEERGLEAWDNYCQDSRYPHLGISKGEGSEFQTGEGSNKKGGGGRIFKGGGSDFSRGVLAKMNAKAHTWGKTTHGYGIADLTQLRQIVFDTIASSTWLVGQKFGDICIFDRGQYKRIYAGSKEGKKERKQYQRYFTRIGCDPKKIEANNREEINRANILAWMNLSARLQVMRPSSLNKPALRLVSTTQPQEQPETASGADISPVDAPLSPSEPQTAPEAPKGRVIPMTLVPRPPEQSLTSTTTTEAPISVKTQRSFFPPNTPGLMCSICSIADQCPKYAEGAVCAFKESFSGVDTRDVNSVVEELGSIFAVNVERARYSRLQEELIGGGMSSKVVTEQMETTFHMGVKLAELMKGRKKTTTTIQGEGMLKRLFGSLGEAPPVTLTADSKDAQDVAELAHVEVHEQHHVDDDGE